MSVVAAEHEDAHERLVVGWTRGHGLRAGVDQTNSAEAGRGGEHRGFFEEVAAGDKGSVLHGEGAGCGWMEKLVLHGVESGEGREIDRGARFAHRIALRIDRIGKALAHGGG